MSVEELVRGVRNVVRTGLVLDIPWLSEWDKFAEEVYIDPEDFKDRHLHSRISTLNYTYGAIMEGAPLVPGNGTLAEKTCRAIEGLQKQMNYSILHNYCNGLRLFERFPPEDYETRTGTMNTGLSFLDPCAVGTWIHDLTDAIPATDAYVQSLARRVLQKCDSLFIREYSRWSGWHKEPVVNAESKARLEKLVKEPGKTLVAESTLQRMYEIAEGKYGLPLAKVENAGQV